MNMQEFAALKEGDKIENPMNTPKSAGEVVEAAPNGVRVVWGPRGPHETRFFYSVQSTAWMHWDKAEQLCEDEGCPNAGTPHVCK